MSLYLDTSCLLKTILAEPESARVGTIVAAEPSVVVSTLARLEARVQINARRAGGVLTRTAAARLTAHLDAVLDTAPYEMVAAPLGSIERAELQIAGATAVHCRTIDRLHLAAMQELGLARLLTNDKVQAAAAAALGFVVITP